jgi:hypothetical protein
MTIGGYMKAAPTTEDDDRMYCCRCERPIEHGERFIDVSVQLAREVEPTDDDPPGASSVD